MKKTKKIVVTACLAVAGLITIAADHIDAPAVQSTGADITDFYAFQAEDSNNLVFAANVQGLLSPTATSSAAFEENVMIEFNIDNNNDNVEDLVIQAIPRNGVMHFFGPFIPNVTGLNSVVNENATKGEVAITDYSQNAVTSTNSNGMKFFAGPRDDPFFMDFARYGEIIGGTASGFNNPGTDTFAGTNVLSVVVEVPKAMLGNTTSINTWVEAKIKQ